MAGFQVDGRQGLGAGTLSQLSQAGRDFRDYPIKCPHFTEESNPEKGSVMSRAAW